MQSEKRKEKLFNNEINTLSFLLIETRTEIRMCVQREILQLTCPLIMKLFQVTVKFGMLNLE